jgi:hypothetical protein
MPELTDAQKAEIKSQVETLLAGRGIGPEAFQAVLKADSEDRKVDRALNIFRGNGFERLQDADRFLDKDERENNRITYRRLVDALGTTESTIFIPRVLTTIVREATEPVIVLSSNIFRRLRVPAMTTMVQFPSVGAIQAFDIAEGEEYPDQKLEGAGWVIAKIGKSGVKVRLTEELIRYSSFDLIGLHVRAAGRALARLKEVKCANLLNTKGITSFDNSGGTSIHGKTTGRNIDTAGNNTMILHDIFQMYADLVNRGFIPTDFIVNPIGWLLFAREPSMRAWAFQNGGALYQAVQGAPGRGQPTETPNLGPSSGGGTTFGTINQATTMASMPQTMFPMNVGMVVSPFVNFDSTASPNTTTIHLVDRDEVGVIVQDEDVVSERFDDPHRDIQIIKFRERYGLAVSNNGEGIATAKNISIERGFDFEEGARLSISPTGSPVLPPII